MKLIHLHLKLGRFQMPFLTLDYNGSCSWDADMELILLHLKKRKFQTWFVITIFCKTYTLLQSANHVVNHVDGVVINNNWWSKVRQQMWHECRWWSARVDGKQKLVGPSDEMEKGGVTWWHGLQKGGVKWWGILWMWKAWKWSQVVGHGH